MGKFTSKRYGRAREALSNDETVSKSATSSAIDNGNGDAGTGNAQTSQEPVRTGEGSRRIVVNGRVFDNMNAASMYMATL